MRAYSSLAVASDAPIEVAAPLKPLVATASSDFAAAAAAMPTSNKRSLSRQDNAECFYSTQAAQEAPSVPRQTPEAPCTKLFNAFIQRAVPRFVTGSPRTRGMLVELIIRKVEESYPDAFVEYCSSCPCGKSRVVPRDRVRAFTVNKLVEASKKSLAQKQMKAQRKKAQSLKVQQANEAFRKQEGASVPAKRQSQVQFKLPCEDERDAAPSPSSVLETLSTSSDLSRSVEAV
jgi:hypothetical protein